MRAERQRILGERVGQGSFWALLAPPWGPSWVPLFGLSWLLAASGSPAPTLGSQGRAVLCRGRAGETRRFKDCLHGSRTTVVPADRQMCLVDRDCQVVWGDRDCQVVRGDSDCQVVWGDRDCQVAGVAGAVR